MIPMKIKRFELNNIREVILQIGDKKGPIKTQYKLVKLKKEDRHDKENTE
jgi:hypothetical protein